MWKQTGYISHALRFCFVWRSTFSPFLTFLPLCVSEVRSVEESTELVINASTTINNLSYYQGESSVIRIRHTHVSERKKRKSMYIVPVFVSNLIILFCLTVYVCSVAEAVIKLKYGCSVRGYTGVRESLSDWRSTALYHQKQRCVFKVVIIKRIWWWVVKVIRVCVLRLSASVCVGSAGFQESRRVLLGVWSPHKPLCGSQEQNHNKRRRSHPQVTHKLYLQRCVNSPRLCFCFCLYPFIPPSCFLRRLIDCLRDFGPRDWLLATQVCQTLWNCTEDRQQEYAQELLEILYFYSGAEIMWDNMN